MEDGCPRAGCGGTVTLAFKVAYATVDPEGVEDLSAYDTVTETGTCGAYGGQTWRLDPASAWQPVLYNG